MGNVLPTVAVDVMGSDLGPEELILGVKQVLSEDKGQYQIIIVGNEEVTTPLLLRHGLLKDSRIKSYNAKEVVTMEEKPIQALKQKKDSSMIRAIEIVKIGTADAVLSCGNTGALMAGGTIKLRTMQGIERPALGTVIPGKKKNFIMIDVGASPDPKPESLVDNAILGANYAKVALGVENPVIGLLSNGTEDGKGNMLVQTAHRLFKAQEGVINYGGLLEGFGLFDGDFDVVVCDGFTGNVVLKSLEGSMRMFKDILKEEIMKSILSKIGIFLVWGAFKGVKRRLPIEKFSGAPLLGLNGLVVKAHGSSNRKQIAGALEITLKCLRNNMNEKISEDIAKLESIVTANKKAALEKENAGL
ncbi:MAG: phosphate acyltransferase PlsX [Opitutales bacterium]|nr:phosphate acyltransferase PlsX [Opitutales bacterium]